MVQSHISIFLIVIHILSCCMHMRSADVYMCEVHTVFSHEFNCSKMCFPASCLMHHHRGITYNTLQLLMRPIIHHKWIRGTGRLAGWRSSIFFYCFRSGDAGVCSNSEHATGVHIYCSETIEKCATLSPDDMSFQSLLLVNFKIPGPISSLAADFLRDLGNRLQIFRWATCCSISCFNNNRSIIIQRYGTALSWTFSAPSHLTQTHCTIIRFIPFVLSLWGGKYRN